MMTNRFLETFVTLITFIIDDITNIVYWSCNVCVG